MRQRENLCFLKILFISTLKEIPSQSFLIFLPFGVPLDGAWWSTVEHYFQAQKFEDQNYREKIRRSQRPKDAKALDMARHLSLRSDWGLIKDGVMRRAVQCKFSTHKSLSDLLLSTGERLIVENVPMDAYWGCGHDGNGLNKLGQILMSVRTEIREHI